MNARHFLLGAAGAALLSAPAMSFVASSASPIAASPEWVRSEVFFGLTIPGGGSISEGDWERFLNDDVTPLFPDGLSVLDSAGQWRNAQGCIDREHSKVLVLLHHPDKASQAKIDRLRDLWCRRHHQESVMKVTSFASVAF